MNYTVNILYFMVKKVGNKMSDKWKNHKIFLKQRCKFIHYFGHLSQENRILRKGKEMNGEPDYMV